MNRNKKVIARAMAVAVATGAVGAYNYQTSGTVAMAKEETAEMLEQADRYWKVNREPKTHEGRRAVKIRKASSRKNPSM